jgi:Putative peptidoglycan binding domain
VAAILRIGSRGGDVIQAQALLNLRPPSALPPLQIDGIFGPRTAARVAEFQRNNGLVPDGEIGPNTIAALMPDIKGSLSKAEFDSLIQQVAAALRSETKSNAKALAFFNRHSKALELSAFSPSQNAIGSIANNRQNIVGAPNLPANIQLLGAIPLGIAIGIVAIIVALFTLALLIAMSQNKGANPADIRQLELEFDRRIEELNRKISSAPFDIAIFIVLIKITVEQAVKDQIERLKRQIERCNALNQNPKAECPAILREVFKQMDHCVQQSLVLTIALQNNPQSPAVKAQLIGLAKSFGFLMLLISKFGKCMGCEFLIFF